MKQCITYFLKCRVVCLQQACFNIYTSNFRSCSCFVDSGYDIIYPLCFFFPHEGFQGTVFLNVFGKNSTQLDDKYCIVVFQLWGVIIVCCNNTNDNNHADNTCYYGRNNDAYNRGKSIFYKSFHPKWCRKS